MLPIVLTLFTVSMSALVFPINTRVLRTFIGEPTNFGGLRFRKLETWPCGGDMPVLWSVRLNIRFLAFCAPDQASILTILRTGNAGGNHVFFVTSSRSRAALLGP